MYSIFQFCDAFEWFLVVLSLSLQTAEAAI